MKEGRITRRKMMETVLTLEKLQPIVEDLRDLIKSTAKATRAEFRREIEQLQAAVTEHTRMIRENGEGIRELKEEVRAMEGRLTEKIDGNSRRLDQYDHRVN